MKTNLLDGICDIRPGEGEILKSARQTAEIRRILKRCTSICRNLGIGVNRCRERFAVNHTSPIQNIQHVLPL
jgi:hypothetical protein